MPHGIVTMYSGARLRGREEIISDVRDLLKGGRSVLLFGPEAIGKSAIIGAVGSADVLVIDPFAHVSAQRAYELRRAMDHGRVVLAAAREPNGRRLGAVGRILWRFSTIRVRELPDVALRHIIVDEIGDVQPDVDVAWVREMVNLAAGRPGFAAAMARFAREWRDAHGYLPLPALAFAAMRQDAVIRTLRP